MIFPSYNQHPPEFSKSTDRFVVMLQVGTVKGQAVFEPLSYGLKGQPDRDLLLRRGMRGSSFLTEELARRALLESAERWNAAGSTWHRRKQVKFLKVEL